MIKDWAAIERRLTELTTCEESNAMRKRFYGHLVKKFGYLDSLTLMSNMKIGSPYYKRAFNIIRDIAMEPRNRRLK